MLHKLELRHYAAVAILAFSAPLSWAQNPADHTMVTPTDLKWADVASVPPGAKIAVMEGPLNEAVPITFRLKFPPTISFPPTGIRALSTSR